MEQLSDSNEEITTLLKSIVQVKNELLDIKENLRPIIGEEIYLKGEEVCKRLHISKRSLQQYRDDGIIPYIQIQGKILFKESDILKLLEDNYR